jgi:hypothetical protein
MTITPETKNTMSGTLYTGKSADGSDMYPAQGMYMSPDGEQWSNQPYTEEDKMWGEIYPYLAYNRRTLRDEYKLIKEKKSPLSRRLRDYVVHLMEVEL